tara:strand:+ start:6977 stop:8305 length:1329 start_codon:yes stop_codon:yes gene_type:complete
MRTRFMMLLVALAAGGTLTTALADEGPDPIVRTQLVPAQALVGQTVTLSVEVLVPGWFTAPIDYPGSINLPGVSGQQDRLSSSNLNERIDGINYLGITSNYQLIALQTGDYVVPALPLTVHYSMDGQAHEVILRTTEQRFSAGLPEELAGLGYVIATRDYQLEQNVDQSLTGLKVGDAITRQLIQRAEGVAAMVLPALEFAALPGMDVYPAEPQLSDSGSERGSISIGERRQEVSYLLREPGHYQLPGLSIGWFDPASKQLHWSKVPALNFEVAANPALAAELLTRQSATGIFNRLYRWVGALLIALLLGECLRRGWPALSQLWKTARLRWVNSEAAIFRRCRRRLSNATPAQALSSTLEWLSQTAQVPGSMPLEDFASRYGDAQLRHQLVGLQQHLFTLVELSADWESAAFARSLAAARRRWLRSHKARCLALQLPALNPN